MPAVWRGLCRTPDIKFHDTEIPWAAEQLSSFSRMFLDPWNSTHSNTYFRVVQPSSLQLAPLRLRVSGVSRPPVWTWGVSMTQVTCSILGQTAKLKHLPAGHSADSHSQVLFVNANHPNLDMASRKFWIRLIGYHHSLAFITKTAATRRRRRRPPPITTTLNEFINKKLCWSW